MDKIGLSIFTGIAPWSTRFDKSVANRFDLIKSTFKTKKGDYFYDGYRCKGENLAWRMWQDVKIPWVRRSGWQDSRWWMHPLYWIGETLLPLRIRLGLCDKYIEAAWHSAASSEYYYSFEKEWDFPL